MWDLRSLREERFPARHGEKLRWKRLAYSVCSAVAAGELYWQLFGVTLEVGVLRQVKEEIFRLSKRCTFDNPDLVVVSF